MSKYKNLIFIGLLAILFVEVLIIFPSKLEHEDEAEVRARVEAQKEEQRVEKERLASGGQPRESDNLAEQKMEGVHLVESQQGTRDWELFAKAAEGSHNAGNWKLSDVKVYFYNNEKVEFTVTGDTGSIDAKSKDLSIVGNVVTKSENGYSFKTPSVFYSSDKRIITSPQEVIMQGPRDNATQGMSLKGQKMQVFVDQSKMIIKDKVSATKPEKNGKSIQVVADGAEFSGRHHEAKFLGSVRMSYDNMKLEGPEASFIYSKASNILDSIRLSGGVKVSDVDKFATAESVNFDLLSDQYVFKGRPKVIQGNDELTGEEIVFLDGGKKVRVDRVRAKVENKD